MMWWTGEWNSWAALAMSPSMILFWGLLFWGMLSIVRGSGRSASSSGTSGSSDPEQLLKERFARGEIDADGYEQRREVLRR